MKVVVDDDGLTDDGVLANEEAEDGQADRNRPGYLGLLPLPMMLCTRTMCFSDVFIDDAA